MINVGFGVTVLNNSEAVGGIDGIGTYTKELKKQLELYSEQLSLQSFTVGMAASQSKLLEQDIFKFGRFRTSLLASLLTGLPFSKSSSLGKQVDIVHATDHYIPNVGATPLVATVMDAIPLSHPEWTSGRLRSIKNFLWVKSAHWADRIITISEFSKSEISHHFDIPLDKIDVVPLGVDERWSQEVSDEVIDETKEKFNLVGDFFLFVGTIQPRKNIQRLIDAYLSLPITVRSDIPLVIIGRNGWGCDDLVSKLTSGYYGTSILWLKHISDEELLSLMKSALSLVYPSLFEGFGLPVLEAFAAGTPVITSNTTSLPEVAGDAALLVNPLDVQNIAEAMVTLIENEELRDLLKSKGLQRAKEFSWQATALKTLNVYEKVLESVPMTT